MAELSSFWLWWLAFFSAEISGYHLRRFIFLFDGCWWIFAYRPFLSNRCLVTSFGCSFLFSAGVVSSSGFFVSLKMTGVLQGKSDFDGWIDLDLTFMLWSEDCLVSLWRLWLFCFSDRSRCLVDWCYMNVGIWSFSYSVSLNLLCSRRFSLVLLFRCVPASFRRDYQVGKEVTYPFNTWISCCSVFSTCLGFLPLPLDFLKFGFLGPCSPLWAYGQSCIV